MSFDVEHFFHVSVGYFYVFFGEMSIEVLLPILNQPIFFFASQWCEVFMYFGYLAGC
jgi:hypothetical protein